MALGFIEDYRPLSAVILSDSLSSLQILASSDNWNSPTTLEILSKYKSLFYQGIDVTFLWIPSHSDIRGNEVADFLAKQALSKNTIDIHLKPNISEMNCLIFNSLKPPCHVFPALKNRRDQIIIHRLRAGVARLTGFKFRLKDHPNGLCDHCNVYEDVKHYLLDCKKYTTIRKKYLYIDGKPPPDLTDVFQNVQDVLKYTRETKLYYTL